MKESSFALLKSSLSHIFEIVIFINLFILGIGFVRYSYKKILDSGKNTIWVNEIIPKKDIEDNKILVFVFEFIFI